MGGRHIQVAAAAMLIGMPVAARADDAPALAGTAPSLAGTAPSLLGAAAWARVIGNTVTGTTPDGPYSELFAPDGDLTIVDSDGKAGGRWALKGDRLCTRVDDEDEECRAVEVEGPAGAFTDEGGTRYPFTILPGNPKGL